MDFEIPRIKAAVTDARGKELARTDLVLGRDFDEPLALLGRTSAALQSWLGALPYRKREISSVGIGLPGFLRDGMLSLAGQDLPGWRRIPFREHFERVFSAPVHLAHDVHLMALAELEHRGWQQGILLFLALRPALHGGVRAGACLCQDGRPYLGGRGNGGALFHATIPAESLVGLPDDERAAAAARTVVNSLVHVVPLTDPDYIVIHASELGSAEEPFISACEGLLRSALSDEYVGPLGITSAQVRDGDGAAEAARAAMRRLFWREGPKE
ncbi:MAG: ROK family protein [Candidatus Bipolaricaulota bacterium]